MKCQIFSNRTPDEKIMRSGVEVPVNDSIENIDRLTRRSVNVLVE